MTHIHTHTHTHTHTFNIASLSPRRPLSFVTIVELYFSNCVMSHQIYHLTYCLYTFLFFTHSPSGYLINAIMYVPCYSFHPSPLRSQIVSTRPTCFVQFIVGARPHHSSFCLTKLLRLFQRVSIVKVGNKAKNSIALARFPRLSDFSVFNIQ